MGDMVNQPPHYQGEIECIDAIASAFGREGARQYAHINAFKYVWRANYKNGDEDIRKAIWYLRYSIGDDPRRDLVADSIEVSHGADTGRKGKE